MTTIFSKSQTVVERSGAFNSALFELESSLTGKMLLSVDEEYETARLQQNRLFDCYPDVIVQAANGEDVALAIRFARFHGLTLSIRSGGHSFSGHAANDGGMVIDLRPMNKVAINPETKVARVQPAATSRVLGEAAQEYGLAISTGDAATVGIGGLVLGGGIGWMVREQGLTIDHLISAEMVTAEGQLLRASADENQDLFWALRGGGGNFGVVTELELQLHEVGMVYAGMIALPLEADVLRAYADYAMAAPNQLTTIADIMAAPPAPFVPENVVGKPVAIIMLCYSGDPEEGAKVVEPLRQIATPLFEVLTPMPYPAIYEFTDEATQPLPFVARSLLTKDLPDDVIETFVDAMSVAGPMDILQIRPLGGAFAAVPSDATAFAHRDAGFMLASIGIWEPGQTGESNTVWAQCVYETVAHHSSGAYVNWLQDEPERIGEAYPKATYRRLAEVKRRYDPENVFKQNVNILPA